jgi:hypothetical protein
MITSIQAMFHCDGCGEPFIVDIDPNKSTSQFLPDVFEIAVDAVRGGNAGGGCTSVQHGRHLCESCTRKVDAMVPDEEDRNATEAEVRKALA